MIYRWATGARPHGDVPAQAIGEWLDGLRKDGPLTPAAVRDAARPKTSPGHSAIFWKARNEAAEAWYEQEAAYVLRTIVTVGEDGKDHRAFLNVVVQEERRYEPIAVVMNSDELRAQLLERALAEARDWQARYRDLAELAKVFQAIDEAGS